MYGSLIHPLDPLTRTLATSRGNFTLVSVVLPAAWDKNTTTPEEIATSLSLCYYVLQITRILV